ncbi:serine hydrolase domain-containing protein [Micromonospora sp. CPCC 206060]|uniref:serine hydrolase domain-containing protein n=1 Tax=Micromonospora sp. CPCC 206060 TaxID=3122406 RepID=UPI002FF3AE84
MRTEDVVAAVDVAMAQWRIAGATVVVVRDDDTWVLPRGHRGGAGSPPTSAHTVYPMGCLSRCVGAATVARLVREGVTSWDAPHLVGAMPAGPPDRGCSLGDLMSHSSGIPTYTILLDADAVSIADIAAHRLRHLTARWGPGTRYVHSELSYLLACHLASELGGQGWRSMLSALLTDVAAKDAYLGRAPAPGDAARPAIWGAEAGAFLSQPIGTASALAEPIDGLWLSGSDMAALIRFFLTGCTPDRGRLLGAEHLDRIRQSRIKVPRFASPHAADVVPQGYALGWLEASRHTRRLLVHSGTASGMRGLVVLLPAERVGVGVFCNVDDPHVPTGQPCCFRCAVAFGLVDALLDRRPFVVPERGPRPVAPTGTIAGTRPEPDIWQRLRGDYEHPGFGRVTFVDDSSGQATFRYASLSAAVCARSGTLAVDWPPGQAATGQSPLVVEGVDADHVDLRMESSVAPFRFVRVPAPSAAPVRARRGR